MQHLDESSAGVVAILLDDLAPPRLGTLLRGARRDRGLSRREVADRVGTTTSDMRRFERGDTPVPPHLVAEFAECYGSALTAQLATRAPIQVDSQRMVVGDEIATFESADGDEVLTKYVELVARLRNSQPGEPIALRTDDLVALSNAIGRHTEDVEARIVEVLGCTPREAHSLHAEMLRRKLVLPVAGLVAGLAIVTGVGVASASNPPSAPTVPTTDTAVHQTVPVSHDIPAPAPTTQAPPPTTRPAPRPVTQPTPTTAAPPETHTDVSEPTAPPVAPEERAPEEPAPAAEPDAHPVVTPDTTPMSIPPNETVTIIQP
jgi:transcriptional regulator with XRE-family HTH domain